MINCRLGPREQILISFQSWHNNFDYRKCIWKCCLHNVGHFVEVTMYSSERHYDDVIIGAMASQITSLTIVYSTVYSGADQRKHPSSASLAFVWGILREFPTQMASNAENVSIWWRHHVCDSNTFPHLWDDSRGMVLLLKEAVPENQYTTQWYSPT